MTLATPGSDFIDSLRFGNQLLVGLFTVYEYTPAGSISQTFELPITSASITIDRNSAIRRSGSVTVALVPSVPPPPLLPTGPPGPGSPQPLAPFGNELSIAIGLAVGNSATGPQTVVTTEAPPNASLVEVTDLTGNGLSFALGDIISFDGAIPIVVGGITPLGSNNYLVNILTPLSANVPMGASVQIVQFAQLGLFSITTTTIDATAPNLIVTLDVSDRAFVISQRELTGPYKFPATPGGTYEEEVTALLNMVWDTYPSMPPLQYNFSAANNPIVPSATYNQGQDPWQMALDLAQVSGNELYMDPNGIVTSHAYPDVYKKPVSWFFTQDTSNVFSNPGKTIESGSPYTVPIGIQVTLTKERIFNDVYVTGSGTQNTPGASTSSSSTATGTGGSTSTTSSSPILGHAADNNPQSATYVEGPLGDLPEFVSSNLVPTASQATAMASLELAMSISSSWQIEITVQPNPLIDVDDVVSVNYPSIGVNGGGGTGLCMVVDSITTGGTYADVSTITGRVVPGRYA